MRRTHSMGVPPIVTGCATPGLVALAIRHIRTSIPLDFRIFVHVTDDDVASARSIAVHLKTFGVANVEVVRLSAYDASHARMIVWFEGDWTPYLHAGRIVKEVSSDEGHLDVATLLPHPTFPRVAPNAWDACTTGRERLQRALFETVPVHPHIKAKIDMARIFGPDIASYVFVHTGGIAALDPRRIITSDPTTHMITFVSTLASRRNMSMCTLQVRTTPSPLSLAGAHTDACGARRGPIANVVKMHSSLNRFGALDSNRFQIKHPQRHRCASCRAVAMPLGKLNWIFLALDVPGASLCTCSISVIQ